ncbi:MAG: chitobiase/beta-hexosaminidase C-terminal domain-containing protein [Marinilabiliaceae bacterium]|nr:chitobiase/beta-hexosaminidase C-terminal domain-containing protein [Marinilabiliaceae bacterium]
MKKVLLLCLLSLFSFAFQGYSQGLETFDNFSEGTSYKTGSFTGQDGSTWNYVGSRGDLSIDGSSLTLGKSSTAAVTSGSITGGCLIISFDYQQAYGSNVNLELRINGSTLATVTTSGEQGVKKNSGEIAVNVTGDFTIGFAQASGGRQVIIDNISWTGNAGSGDPIVEKPVLSIEAGIYTSAQSVTITSATADAAIYYTTDGTIPTDASTLYENPVSISSTTTLKAIAYKAGMTESSVASATYSFPVEVATIAEL